MQDDDSDSISSDSDNEPELPSVDTEPSKVLSLQDDDSVLILKNYENDYEEDGEDEEEDDFHRPSTSPVNRNAQPIESSHSRYPVADVGEIDRQKRKRKKKLYICLTGCKYPVVRLASRRFGFKIVDEEDDWHLYWTDSSVTLDRVLDMKRYQKINHFPGMSEICRKDFLSRNLNRMLKAFPKDYNIFPRSWCLPADYADFQTFSRQHRHKSYILKPDSSCQGKGIWITKNPSKVSPHEDMVCQVYLTKPLLIDGFKFDLRVYVLVASCDPLRIFCYKEGLARFCTKSYKEPTNNNVDDIFLHLTNYAVQKRSTAYNVDDEAGTKRRLTTVTKYLREQGHDVEKLWSDVDDVIIKTIISAYAVLRHNYRTCFPQHAQTSACFEILGFDIILDHRLKPYVLEVNHSPSFTTDAPIDKEVKLALIYDTLNLVNFAMCDKKKVMAEDRKKFTERLMLKSYKKESKEEIEAAEADYIQNIFRWEETHMGNFRRIYPIDGRTERYERFCTHGSSLFTETAACKARAECSRQQREEIFRKQQQLTKMLRKNPVCPESPERRPSIRNDPNSLAQSAQQRYTTFQRRAGQTRLSRHSSLAHQTSAPASPSSNGQNTPTSSVYQLQTQFAPSAPPSHLPMTIDEQEEISRLSSLMQRENLIRKLGIVDLIRVIVNSANRQPPIHHSHQQQHHQNQQQHDPKAHSAATLAAIQHRLQAEEADVAAVFKSSNKLSSGAVPATNNSSSFVLSNDWVQVVGTKPFTFSTKSTSDNSAAVNNINTSSNNNSNSNSNAAVNYSNSNKSKRRPTSSKGGSILRATVLNLLPPPPPNPPGKTSSSLLAVDDSLLISMVSLANLPSENETKEAVINQDRIHASGGNSQAKLSSQQQSASVTLANDLSGIDLAKAGSSNYGRPGFIQGHSQMQQIVLTTENGGHNSIARSFAHSGLPKSSSVAADMHGAGIQGHGLVSNTSVPHGLLGHQGITGIGIDPSNSSTPKRVRSASANAHAHNKAASSGPSPVALVPPKPPPTHIPAKLAMSNDMGKLLTLKRICSLLRQEQLGSPHSSQDEPIRYTADSRGLLLEYRQGQLQAVLTGTSLRTGPQGHQTGQPQSQHWQSSVNNVDDGASSVGNTGQSNNNLFVRLPGLNNGRSLLSNGPPQATMFLPAVLEFTNNPNSNNPTTAATAAQNPVNGIQPSLVTVGSMKPTNRSTSNNSQTAASRYKLLS